MTDETAPEQFIIERPRLDPEIESHEGFSDDEMAMTLELHAAMLDRAGAHGIALDIRGGAARIRKLSKESA